MNKLSIGIVGLPNVGKSTLFNLITRQAVPAANYPFCTIDPNVGIVAVPDERLEQLSTMSQSAQSIPAVVEFYDIAGLVRGAAEGAGLGNQFLTHIRGVHAIVQVLRCFPSDDISHVDGSVDSLRDLETINAELALKDLDTLERFFKRVEGDAKSASKQAKTDFEAFQQAREALSRGELLASEKHANVLDNIRIKELQLLTAKPQLFLINGAVAHVPDVLIKKINSLGAEYVITDLASADAVPALIQAAYRTLGLISFFTTGPKETRAWTTYAGASAPEAAGVIHTDFQQKFIRAEAVHCSTLLECGGWVQAQRAGKIRTEGKTYVVQDGDVLVIRHGG